MRACVYVNTSSRGLCECRLLFSCLTVFFIQPLNLPICFHSADCHTLRVAHRKIVGEYDRSCVTVQETVEGITLGVMFTDWQ